MQTDWPVLRVRKGKVFFKITPVQAEDGLFDIFIENEKGNVLIATKRTFEDSFEDINALATVFGVLGYVIEHRF